MRKATLTMWLCVLTLLAAPDRVQAMPRPNCTVANSGCATFCREREEALPPTFKHCRLCRCRTCDMCILAWADGFTLWKPPYVLPRQSKHHATFLTSAVITYTLLQPTSMFMHTCW